MSLALSPTDKREIANIYKTMHANTHSNTKNNKADSISEPHTDITLTNSTTDDAFRDHLNNLYLAINDSNHSSPNDPNTNYSIDVSDKTNTIKTKKILKTEKVLRAIALQYSDISPSPAKVNNDFDNSINVASNYKRSIEEEIKKKKTSVTKIKLERLQLAKDTIPEKISYVDINEQ